MSKMHTEEEAILQGIKQVPAQLPFSHSLLSAPPIPSFPLLPLGLYALSPTPIGTLCSFPYSHRGPYALFATPIGRARTVSLHRTPSGMSGTHMAVSLVLTWDLLGPCPGLLWSPVLTSGMLLPGPDDATVRTDRGAETPLFAPRFLRIVLRVCYAMSGTDRAYAATRSRAYGLLEAQVRIGLRVCYAMSGTK
eukprot:1875107-Rhodomonas_salina.1